MTDFRQHQDVNGDGVAKPLCGLPCCGRLVARLGDEGGRHGGEAVCRHIRGLARSRCFTSVSACSGMGECAPVSLPAIAGRPLLPAAGSARARLGRRGSVVAVPRDDRREDCRGRPTHRTPVRRPDVAPAAVHPGQPARVAGRSLARPRGCFTRSEDAPLRTVIACGDRAASDKPSRGGGGRVGTAGEREQSDRILDPH